MTEHATGTTPARRGGTAGLAAGFLALLLAATGCSSAGTTAAPSRSAAPAPPTTGAPATPSASSVPQSTPPQSTPPPVVPPVLPSASVEPPAPSDPVPVIYGCTGEQLSEPRSFPVGCGAGTGQLDGLTWKDWGGLAATGTGRLWQTTAAGGVAAYPATVTLGGLTGGDYTTMRISAPKADKANLELALAKTGPTLKG
ncbi:hypothetical protein ACIGZJ_14655 [Kitasatospora sp. NPDC052868]|uniref:hypothetical protein n=1 Tax=Kitasatospora sp. NPDC052868 TaxID=3364060 RepID=UPI0037CAB76A